jgi:hypothetical protein
MNPETINQITQYLDKIGEKIGQGAETIWPWLVRQVYIDGSIAIGVFILCSFCLITSLIFVLKNEKFAEELWGIVPFTAIVSAFSFVAAIVFASRFLNPEYWALMDLLERVKP